MSKLGTGANGFIAYLATSLASGGSETTIYLSTLKTLTGETLSTADFSVLGQGTLTIDPLNASNIEYATFGAVDGANLALTSAVRNQSSDATGSAARTAPYHPVGTLCIISWGVHDIKQLTTFSNRWALPVANFAALPAGVYDGETRVTLDDSKIYVWSAGSSTWNLAGAGGGAGTVYITTKLGSDSDGGDLKTFSLNSGSFPADKYLQVFVNGILMENGASADYQTSGSNKAVFKYDLLDSDKVTLLVVSVDIYNPAWNNVTGSLLPDVDNAYDIGSALKEFKDIYLKNTASGTATSSTNKMVDQAYFQAAFGDGADSNVTISSPTTLTSDMYYDTLTVNDTLTTNGFRIFCKTEIKGSGTIKWGTPNNGGNASNGTGGTAAAQGGIGALKNTAGVAGANGVTSGSLGDGANGTAGLSGRLGGAGVAGGNAGANANNPKTGGTAGANVQQSKPNLERWSSFSVADIGFVVRLPCGAGSGASGGNVSVSGGSGNTQGGGGGSGATGGTIWIAARTWSGTFTIESKGGNGGNGAASVAGTIPNITGGGGGSGGNGGCAIVIYNTKTWSGSYTLTGGTPGNGGAGVGTGNNGSNGNSGNTGTSYEIDVKTLI